MAKTESAIPASTPAELEADFQAALEAARLSGRRFRAERSVGAAGGAVVYLTDGENQAIEAAAAAGAVERQKTEIRAQLLELDRQTLAAVRGLREFILAQAQVTDFTAQGGAVPIPNFQPFSSNVGIQRLAAAEAQAIALRAQLAALDE